MSIDLIKDAPRLADQTIFFPVSLGSVMRVDSLTKDAFWWLAHRSLDATLTEEGIDYPCAEANFTEDDVVFTFSLPAGRKVFITLTKDNVVVVKGNPACKDVLWEPHAENPVLTLKAPQIMESDWEVEASTLVSLTAKPLEDRVFFSYLAGERGLDPYTCPVVIQTDPDTQLTRPVVQGRWCPGGPHIKMAPLYLEGGIAYLFVNISEQTWSVWFDDALRRAHREPSVTLMFSKDNRDTSKVCCWA